MEKSDKIFLASQGVGILSQLPSIIYQSNLAKQQKKEAAVAKLELDRGEATGEFDYARPQEITESLNAAKMLSNQGLPAAQRQAAEQDIMRSQNFALNAATERGGGLNSISGIQSSTGDAYRNLAVMDAQQRMQNIQNLQNQQQMAAAYADKEWQYNVYDPFMRKLQSYQDLKGASIQNKMGMYQGIGSAGKDVAGAGTQYAMMQQQQQGLDPSTLAQIGATAAAASDYRFKENIEYIETKNNIRYYTWKWNTFAKEYLPSESLYEPYGVIAQELAQTNPELVLSDKNGYLFVNYSELK